MSVYTHVPKSSLDLDRTADRIKRLYVQQKSNQIGGKYKLQNRFAANDALWLNAAKICLELKMSPSDIVDALFEGNKVPGGPFPNQLGGLALYGYAKQYKKVIGSKKGYWALRMNHLKTYLSGIETATEGRVRPVTALLTPLYNADVVPLLACCGYPLPVIIETYGQQALRAIDEDPSLLEIITTLNWADFWIPQARATQEKLRHEQYTKSEGGFS